MAGTPSELIKEKLDIVDFLRGYLTLQSAGKNFKALCPFHREKTASFMISPDRQSWHCFGCSTGGDIFAFVMKYENIEFGEALRLLAEKAGVELRRASPGEYQQTGLLYELNQAAKDFFVAELARFAPARAYLKERGLSEETIGEFELGWAPNASEALNLHLLKRGYRPEDIVRAGLALRSERSLQFDRFRGRLMFPIHNHFGKVAAFTGRVLPQLDDGQSGKYVNSPETPVFSKSKLLYGFWKSKNYIRERQSVFLVEGQMDFLMSWQSGIKNVVASSGTALTFDHLQTLKRLTDKLIISFDADEAGLAAGERAIDLAEANDFNVNVVLLKGFKDPAEAAAKNPEQLREAVEASLPAPEFYFSRYLPSLGIAEYRDRGALRSLRAVLQKLQQIASPVERGFWFKELSRRTGLSENVLLEEAGQQNIPKAPIVEEEGEATTAPKLSRLDLISERLLAAAAAENTFPALQADARYFSPGYEQAFKTLESGAKRSGDGELDELLNRILLHAEILPAAEFEELRRELAREYLKEHRRRLARAVKEAEASGDNERLKIALQELSQLPASLTA